MNNHETPSFFARLKKGMHESIAHSRGEISLKMTTLPAAPSPVGRAEVVALRKKLQMSQSVFAATLNVSLKLVQGWEQGTRTPGRGELRLIEMLRCRPDLIQAILSSEPLRPPANTSPVGKPTVRKRKASVA